MSDPSFAQVGLIEPLLRALQTLGYARPTAVQGAAIRPLLQGRDLRVAAQTGTGKTAAFLLPLLQRLHADNAAVASNGVRAVVLAPTRELAQQLYQSLRGYGQFLALRSVVVYGGVSINPQMMALRRGADVLVATPGRLLDLHRKNAVRFTQVRVVVLDEADRMLDLGFKSEMDQLFHLFPKKRQTVLFSATFPPAIETLAAASLRDPVRIDISPQQPAAVAVEQWVIPVDKRRKAELLCELLAASGWPQALVFAGTRKKVSQLQQILLKAGAAAEAIHGDKAQPARLRALQRFRAGEVRLLVATDVAARGLDIEEMPLVINFDLPVAAEDYVHRIGRTGRAGRTGQAISLIAADEVERLRDIEALLGRLLPRQEHEGFEPDHLVPVTTLRGGGAGKNPSAKPAPPHRRKAGRSATATPASRSTALAVETTTGKADRPAPPALRPPVRIGTQAPKPRRKR